MPDRIAIFGAAGQLGSALVARLGERALPLTRADADLAAPEPMAAAIERLRPDAVINAAAYNFVDRAETEPAAAFAGNACGPLYLARACARHDIPLYHVSTDYVFGAAADRLQPYTEDDAPGPVSVYGASKLAGEHLVRLTAPRHLIVRTCGLYGRPPAGGKGNFVETIRRLAGESDEIRIVDDQRCSPTSAGDLAAAMVPLIETAACGTYHAVNSGDCTWYEFACAIVRELGLPTRVIPITTAEFPRPAHRPRYSVLGCDKLAAALGGPLRSWREALAEYLVQSRDRQKTNG